MQKEKSPKVESLFLELSLLAKKFGCSVVLVPEVKNINNGRMKHNKGLHPQGSRSQHPVIFSTIEKYLSAPTITDSFKTSHGRRREFYEFVRSYNPELSEWYQTNRLRFNNLHDIGVAVGLIEAPSSHNVQIIEKIINILKIDPFYYRFIPNKRKITLSREIASLLSELDF